MTIRELDTGVWMMSLPTPTLPPATTTNTLVFGRKRVVIVEPATPHQDAQEQLLSELARRELEVVGLALTHHHADHVGAVQRLRVQLQVPVYAHSQTAARVPFAIDRLLDDGASINVEDGCCVRAVFTPGHAPGHLVYVETRTGIAHAGDLVAGVGSILIDPSDGGNMAAYLASLERMRGHILNVLVPAHGPPSEAPQQLIARTIAHRLKREAKIVSELGPTPRSFEKLLACAYGDTPQSLWPIAARSLRAHLDKLVTDGCVEHRDNMFRIT